jgi:hypothetical protein
MKLLPVGCFFAVSRVLIDNQCLLLPKTAGFFRFGHGTGSCPGQSPQINQRLRTLIYHPLFFKRGVAAEYTLGKGRPQSSYRDLLTPNRIFMIVHFSHYHRQPAVCHRKFFRGKGLGLIGIYVWGAGFGVK